MLFSPIVELWGDLISSSPQAFCFKLIGQKKGGKITFLDNLGHQASPRKIKAHPHFLHPCLCSLFPLWAPMMNWPFFMMLRNFVMVALHLFEAFVWARWSGFHLAGQLALFPEDRPATMRFNDGAERSLCVQYRLSPPLNFEQLLWLPVYCMAEINTVVLPTYHDD